MSDRTSEFVSLFARHERTIYKSILTLLPDASAAQEVFQETSVVLWRKFDEFTPDTSFPAWACRVAYYEVLKYRQQRGRERLRFDDDLIETLAAECVSLHDQLETRRQALHDCLEHLSDQQRELIDCRYGEQDTIGELARRTGRPENTLYKMLARTRQRLLDCVTRRLATE